MKGLITVIYGYARVSTDGQARDGNSLEVQIRELEEAGAQVIFKDVCSGYKGKRPMFEKMLKKLDAGDTLVVTKLDRIARSLIQGLQLLEDLRTRDILVHVLNMGMIDNSPAGKLIRNIMLCFSEFERDLIIQRTREGKEEARKKPGYREGRPPKFSQLQIKHALELLETYSYNQVAQMTGISKTSLKRFKKNMPV